jgi:hypothetical protein
VERRQSGGAGCGGLAHMGARAMRLRNLRVVNARKDTP